jgi:hypothetical protein
MKKVEKKTAERFIKRFVPIKVVVRILSGDEKAERRIFPIFFLLSARMLRKYFEVDMKLISAAEKNPSMAMKKNARIM